MFSLTIQYHCVFTLAIVSVDAFFGVAEPFLINILKLDGCEDEGTRQIQYSTKITKTNDGAYVYNESIYLGHPLDELFKLYVEVQSLGNQGYKRRFTEHTFCGCKEMWKHFETRLRRTIASSDITAKGCPIPMGNFSIKNLDMRNIDSEQFPAVLYNHYRGIALFYYNGVKTGCVTAYVETVPKPMVKPPS